MPDDTLRIIHVAGCRPNFVKLAPVYRALTAYPCVDQLAIHTGQHYTAAMSGQMILDVGMPDQMLNLGVESSDLAALMTGLKPVLAKEVPSDRRRALVIVYGDVNSTLAAALTAMELGIPVAHVEAGLRSYDRSMPEEWNRYLTDHIANLLFTPDEGARYNLVREGIPAEQVYKVGNVMIDSLVRALPSLPAIADLRSPALPIPNRYALLTLHRQSNVDDAEWLTHWMDEIAIVSAELPVIFPVHPRTRKALYSRPALACMSSRIDLIDPLPYLSFLVLERSAAVVITDSGGVQEETTYLGVPCLTIRENTERPITITQGTNTLVGRDPAKLRPAVEAALAMERGEPTALELWDGHAADRIAKIIVEEYAQ
jgi:UDP-N-acetylglucosamine 2-epimerase (non-hydrolysing)